MKANEPKNTVTITVDVEDGINIAMRDVFDKELPPTERVVTNTMRILDLFDEQNVKGTFFVLGQVGECYPDLVKTISERGHEIGVHGYDHYRFDKMDPKLARSQLKSAKRLLEDLTGDEVYGHRAPAFSINEKTKWALPLLAELGFKYDSSIMPCRATHYGWKEFPANPTLIQFENGGHIYEIPMTILNLGNLELPFFGGSYFRLLPYWATTYCIGKINHKNIPVFYMHPYEIDTVRYPEFYFEVLKDSPYKVQLKMRSMWVRRGSVIRKLKKLIKSNPTLTMKSMIETSDKNDSVIEFQNL